MDEQKLNEGRHLTERMATATTGAYQTLVEQAVVEEDMDKNVALIAGAAGVGCMLRGLIEAVEETHGDLYANDLKDHLVKLISGQITSTLSEVQS